MSSGFSLVVVPVSDAAAAKAVYSAMLGAEPYVEAPYYVGFKVGDQELGLDPNGHKQGSNAPLAYLEVTDIHATVAAMTAAGATVQRPPSEVGGGKLVATLRDADNNVVGLMQSPS